MKQQQNIDISEKQNNNKKIPIDSTSSNDIPNINNIRNQTTDYSSRPQLNQQLPYDNNNNQPILYGNNFNQQLPYDNNFNQQFSNNNNFNQPIEYDTNIV